MSNELKIKALLIEAINKDGEGKRIKGQTMLERTGKRAWNADPTTLANIGTKKLPDIYVMSADDRQIQAYYVDGRTFVTHHGQERHQIDVYINNAIKQSRKEVSCHVRNSNRLGLPSVSAMTEGFKF